MRTTATTQKKGTPAEAGMPETINENQTPMLSLAELKKKEMEEEVCDLYTRIKEQNPELSYHKLTVMVAAQTGLSPEGIKRMLNRNGIKSSQKRS